MRNFLFVLAVAFSSTAFSQTTLDEFNYANGGYLKLEKLGADSKQGYEIVEDNASRMYSDRWSDSYQIFKLVRTADNSTAAVIFYNKTMKEVYLTAVEPSSEKDIVDMSLSKQRIFSGWVASQPALFIEMVQQAFWSNPGISEAE